MRGKLNINVPTVDYSTVPTLPSFFLHSSLTEGARRGGRVCRGGEAPSRHHGVPVVRSPLEAKQRDVRGGAEALSR